MNAAFDFRAEALVFSSRHGEHLYLVDGSRIFDLDSDTARSIGVELDAGRTPEALEGLIGKTNRYIGPDPAALPPVKSLSLNVAQSCNLSCSYCYADEGRFGGNARIMSESVALAAIDRLIADAPPQSDLLLGFMGGEPFINRRLVHAATRYAAIAAERAGHRMRFSITTNGTLVREADADLLAEFPFAVAVSLDGTRATNDGQRRPRNTRGSAYDAAMSGLSRLVAARPLHLSARATVTPFTGTLPEMLDHLLGLDIDEAGFAPVIAAPPGSQAYSTRELERFLDEMIICGGRAKAAALDGVLWPFSNFQTAIQQIHRGAHMPYPCGAGAGYLSINAEGGYFGCHRLIDDADFAFGDLESGPDDASRTAHLAAAHVDQQEPCKSCWARYLCGGGCYHEVKNRGRIGCDYIRGWLEFCLAAYAELRHARPAFFSDEHASAQGDSNV